MTNTDSSFAFGTVTDSLVGIAMKEMVRRALVAIRNHRFAFEVTGKDAHDGTPTDFVTSADQAAQAIYLRVIRECFPQIGVVAEEEHLLLPSDEAAVGDTFFTVDPLDGTKAFVRRESSGIGTMLALVRDRRVIAAFVGDVMTREMYGFRPGSATVHRISEFETNETLSIDPRRTLEDQYVLLRDLPTTFSPAAQRLMDLSKGVQIARGSIGISAARLWKGEIGFMVLPPWFETPWDLAPVVGISEQLGFGFWEISGQGLEPRSIRVGRQVVRNEAETLVAHTSRLHEFEKALQV